MQLSLDHEGEPLGLYLSIPFCRGKCTFCNFASDAFDPGRMPAYVHTLCAEIAGARTRASRMAARLPETVDTIYLGGGTPSLLSGGELAQIFGAIRREFRLSPGAEITLECAPGQIAAATLDAFQAAGGSRISLGVQSFVDAEAAAVGRRHTEGTCRAEISRLRGAGIRNIGVDLIAGLPLQTPASWRHSLAELLATEADHASVYLFEVDEESRLGREVLESGKRFGAPTVPNDEAMAEMYLEACEFLAKGGLEQYEISNFARAHSRSRHNLKYWMRMPYLGFGLDAHSMLRAESGGELRFANGDELGAYLDRGEQPGDLRVFGPKAGSGEAQAVTADEAVEEMLFLGLRLVEGLGWSDVVHVASAGQLVELRRVLAEARAEGLLWWEGDRLGLTDRGRLLSNELFSRLLAMTDQAA